MHVIHGFSIRLPFMTHPRVPGSAASQRGLGPPSLPFRKWALIRRRSARRTEEIPPSQTLLCRNMNSISSLMIDREHLACAEVSIDPVLPNLNGWNRSEPLDLQLSTNQSGAPSRSEPDAFSCIAAQPFFFSALILKASDDCFYSSLQTEQQMQNA